MLENDTAGPGRAEDAPGAATPATPPRVIRLKLSRRERRALKTPRLLGIAAGIAAMAALGGGFLATQGGANSAAAASSGATTASLVQAASTTTASTPDATVEDFIAKLAARLGIDETTLKTDLTQTSLDELSAQVAAGKLTQAQADQITTSINNGDNYFFGVGGGPGGHGGPGGMRGGPGGLFDHDSAALATFLGIDQATLKSDLQGGQTLATIATAQGETRDELKTFLTNEVTTELNAQVTAGKLTQAQATDMLSQFTANLDNQIDSTPPQRGTGGPGDAPAPATGSSSGTTTS